MPHIILRASRFKITVLLLASLFSLSSHALKDDTNQPLQVVSVEQIADFDSNKAIFIGNVVATQGSIEVHADKAELTRNSDGNLKEVKAYGKPATFKQLQENGKVIHSQSSIIQYLPEKNLLILIGRATIWQENSHVDGERIEYNTLTKQLKASNENSQGGRVQSTFIPQELKSDKSSE
ncbi:MAG: lipopolysaccharide transport periplasmic protein LptA [Succinivibrio sp.]